MSVVQFSGARILPDQDVTELAMHSIIEALQTFEDAAIETTAIGRCVQLHERLFALAQLLEAADGTIRSRWDSLLAKGQDY